TAAYESALNKRDPAAVAALFVPDGDLVFFDSPRVSGRDALIQNTKDAVATWPATMRFTLSITAIRFLTPDVAIVDTEAHFSEGDMRAKSWHVSGCSAKGEVAHRRVTSLPGPASVVLGVSEDGAWTLPHSYQWWRSLLSRRSRSLVCASLLPNPRRRTSGRGSRLLIGRSRASRRRR